MKIDVIEVTPKIAEESLRYNPNNRRIRQTVVDAYARDMKEGRWHLNGETIKFDHLGNLLDGQHRLSAVVQAGVPVQMVVVVGLVPEVQETVDGGIARTAGDALSLRGIPNHFLAAAVARLALIIERGGNFQEKITNSEIVSFIEQMPRLMDSIRRTDQVRKSMKGARPSLVAYADLVLSEIDADSARDFWDAAATLTASYNGDPAVAMARRFADLYVHRQQLSDLETLSIIYRCWNRYRAGDVTRLVKVVPVKSLDDLPRPK